jgi:exoribonuclease R
MKRPLRSIDHHGRLTEGFAAIRYELGVPDGFSAEVEQAARDATTSALPAGTGHSRAGVDPVDLTAVAFVTIDPPTSTDLDQAVFINAHRRGFSVLYAIADPSSFVGPGGPIDQEAHARGLTRYSPDMRTPLYPTSISEGAASLLAGATRPANVWTLELDSHGALLEASVQRAMVRSVEKLSYAEAQRRIDSGDGSPTLMALRDVGELRLDIERERGGVSLSLPAQAVADVDGHYELVYDESLPVENWNAQISLLTGMAAAQLMVEAKIGLLRTLPDPDEHTLDEIRLSALSLGIPWPESMNYADRVRDLRPDSPRHVALLTSAVRALRGADYVAFDGVVPDDRRHWAIASEYAHVTAPLRRLCDRYTNEIALAICNGQRPPEWVLAELHELPATMGRARRAESQLDRAMVDFVEAALLIDRVGESFAATVTANRRDGRSAIQIADPAITAVVKGTATPGTVVNVELVSANLEQRTVEFRFH